MMGAAPMMMARIVDANTAKRCQARGSSPVGAGKNHRAVPTSRTRARFNHGSRFVDARAVGSDMAFTTYDRLREAPQPGSAAWETSMMSVQLLQLISVPVVYTFHLVYSQTLLTDVPDEARRWM